MKQQSAAWPTQAFIIGKQILDSVSLDEVAATFSDMRDCNIAQPPYDRFDVIVPPSSIIRLVSKDGPEEMAADEPYVTLRCRFEGYIAPSSPASFKWLYTRHGKTVDLQNFVIVEMQSRKLGHLSGSTETAWAESAAMLYQLTVVLLATKNVVKETKECKLLKYGIGNKERNRYTTTIKVGAITEHAEGHATGGHKRPHLRRGHVRRQHYGPGHELIKQIFIQPIFVNADEGWIAERTAYNLSGGVPHAA